MPKFLLSPKFGLIFFAVLVFAAAAFAQNETPMDAQRPPDDRPNLLVQLGLTQEQVQQFRHLNAEHRPLMNDAQKRLREATRELDMAIYADEVSDETVREKLKAFQMAHAEINRLRFANELAIRKILTIEQLVRFRGMRRRMAESRKNQRQDARRSDGRRQRGLNPMKTPGNRDQPQRPAENQKRPMN